MFKRNGFKSIQLKPPKNLKKKVNLNIHSSRLGVRDGVGRPTPWASH